MNKKYLQNDFIDSFKNRLRVKRYPYPLMIKVPFYSSLSQTLRDRKNNGLRINFNTFQSTGDTFRWSNTKTKRNYSA